MTSSNPNYLPKVPSPDTSTLGIRVSIYEFGGDADLHSIIRSVQLLACYSVSRKSLENSSLKKFLLGSFLT